MTAAQKYIDKIVEVVVNPLIVLLIAIALVLFLWGLAEFLLNATGTEGRETGKRHMLWGIVGLFVMIAVFGILGVLGNTIGFCDKVPTVVC